MTTTDQALAAGAAARTTGQPSTACPYGDEAADLRTAWVRGWVTTRTTELYGALPRT